MIMHIQSPDTVRTVYSSIFKDFLVIFRDIDAYSATVTGAQLLRRGEASTALSENRKKCPDFRKKGPDCVHLRIKFSCVFDEIFIKVPSHIHNLGIF